MADKKFLIVDDDDANQYLVQEILEGSGYGFEAAMNGADAVEKLRAGHFDIVFMDIRMPVMNGYEAAKAIREFNKDVPIIALTAHAMEAVPGKCLAAGMNDYISKPFEADTIKRVILKWLK